MAGQTREELTNEADRSGQLAVLRRRIAALEAAETERKRAEQALRESEERFQQVAENAEEWIWEVDALGLYTYASSAVERILGYKAEEVVGKKHFYDLFHPQDREEVTRTAFEEFAQKQPFREFPNRNVHKNGETVWLLTSGVPILNEKGDLLGYRGVDADITERVQAEQALQESEELYRTLFENAPLGLGIADADGNLMAFNDAMLGPGGYSPEDIARISNVANLYYDPHERSKVLEIARRQGFLDQIEVQFKRKDGTPYDVLLSLRSVQIEGQFCWQSIVEDITERKRADQLLRTLNQATLAMEQALTPNEIFTALAGEFKKLGFSCMVLLTDENQSRLFTKYLSYESKVLKAAEKLVGLRREDFSIPVETVDVYRNVIREKKTVLMENAEEAMRQVLPQPIKRFARQIMSMLKVQKSIAAPLVVGDEVIGVLSVQSDDLTEADTPAITAFAHQVAAAWHKARLLEQARQEIIERVQAEETLRESEQRYRIQFDEALDAIFIADAETGILIDCNRAAMELIGRAKSDLVGKHQRILHPPEEIEGKLSRTFKQHLKEKEGQTLEAQVITKSGERRDVSIKANILELRGKKVLQGIFRDVTERKQAEEELRRLKEFNEGIVQSMAEGITVEDAEGCFAFVNPAAAALLGFAPQELVGQHWTDIVPPDQQPIVQAADERRARGEADHYELELLRQDGRRVSILISGSPRFEEGRFAGTMAVFTDITERVRAEKALEQRAAQLALLNDIGEKIAAVLELDQVLERAAHLVQESFGYHHVGLFTLDRQRGELVMRAKAGSFAHLFPPGHRLKLQQGVVGWVGHTGETLLANDVNAEPHYTSLYPAVSPTLSELSVPIRWGEEIVGVLDAQSPRRNAFDENDVLVLETLADQIAVAIENARLLAQVREQAEQVQQIVRSVPEGVLLLDTDFRILLVNPAARQYLDVLTDSRWGETLTHLGGRPTAELLTSPPPGLWHEVTADGQSFEVIAQPLEADPVSRGWVLVIRDVTQEREIQQRVQQQERLAAVGQLAAGIAHDFNNIMAIIVLYAGMSSRIPDLPPKVHERLETISQQAKRATDLIQQILDFSRRAVLKRLPMDLAPFLREQIKLLERTLPEHIKIDLAYGAGEYTVNADPTRMQQVIMNLAVNARDAMSEGGELRIGLERIRVESRKEAPLPNMSPGEWVRLTVEDTGTGLQPDVLPHIFNPFFTTKAPGKGSGLGLAQVHGIVKQHEGEIDVTTKVGEGTTFILYLPALSVAKPEALPGERLALPHGQGETILVVEDDAVARKALVDSLEQLNYRALEAANGREALAILEQHADPSTGPWSSGPGTEGSGQGIALVLSDLVMPEMGGQALFHALRQKGLAVPMMMLTGHPKEEELENLRAQGLRAWLLKPPSPEQLAEMVARVLGKEIG